MLITVMDQRFEMNKNFNFNNSCLLKDEQNTQ